MVGIETAGFITLAEFANLLKVSNRTMRRYLSAGRLPAPIRLGRMLRWKLIEVLKWIETGCTVPTGADLKGVG